MKGAVERSPMITPTALFTFSPKNTPAAAQAKAWYHQDIGDFPSLAG
jgi:hypothetical protein